jgi:tetratricopeptide (TPR) repeat protein
MRVILAVVALLVVAHAAPAAEKRGWSLFGSFFGKKEAEAPKKASTGGMFSMPATPKKSASAAGKVPVDANKVAALIKEAKDSLGVGNVNVAADQLLSVLEADPDSFEGNSLIGSCYLVLNRPDLAEQFLYHAVHLSEWKDAVSVANLAESLRLNKDSALAIQVAIKGYEALGKKDESGLIEYVLGASYADQNKYTLAAEWFLSAAMRQPKNVEAWLLASTMKFPQAEHNYKFAENVLVEGLKANEHSVELVHHMGLVMHHTARYDQAIKCFTFVLEQQPTQKEARTMLATSLHAVGDRPMDALNAYNEAVKYDGDNAIMLSNFALLLHSSFNTQVSGDVIANLAERALKIEPQIPEAQSILALYRK